MGKLQDDLVLVRLDKKIYNNFRDYCEENGLVAPKNIGFILRDFLQIKSWKEIPECIKKRKEEFVAIDKNVELGENDG